MLIQGLTGAIHYNRKFGCIQGFDDESERFIVKICPNTQAIKVKRANLIFPALCPDCSGEVTSNFCHSCGFGDHCTDDDAGLRSRPPLLSGDHFADTHSFVHGSGFPSTPSTHMHTHCTSSTSAAAGSSVSLAGSYDAQLVMP